MGKLITLAVITVMCASAWGQNNFHPTGDVGIGTNNPKGKLHVRGGNIEIGDIGYENSLAFRRKSDGATRAFISLLSDNEFRMSNHTGYSYFSFYTNGSNGFKEKVRISSKGYIGIGTTDPDGLLHTAGGISIAHPTISYNRSGDAASRAGIMFGSNHETNNSMFWICPDATSGNKLHIGTGFKYSDDGLFTITNMGNVGIGTTNPTTKLAVNGTIRAKEIKVEATNWPDYVFADDYNLRELSEVENYITTNKHLPDVPSAATMEEEGVNLAEMNKLLLQKVEELTLYVIQQQKEINQLKNK